MTLIVHDTTRLIMRSLIDELPQSLLLSGQRGIGLSSIARDIAGRHLMAELKPQDSKEQADNENGTITVEMIRRLYEQTRARHTTRQVIIVDDADRMSLGAQAAFLKLLEEPNAQIHFILTSHAPQKLLPTIRSRVQQTILQPVSTEQSTELLAVLGITDAKKQAQLRYIAEGLPAELTRLAVDEAYFAERAAIVADARTLIQGDTYASLLIVQKYQSDRERALQLLDSALLISRRSLSTKPQHGLVVQLDHLLRVRENIASNYNIRLQLTQFVL
jgi:DNA polymerase-3 subunit delta'